MKKSICHYSFHRTWQSEQWSCDDLADTVRDLGVEGIDYHVGFLGDREGAADRIRAALARTGLELSGLSMSNDFNQEEPAALDAQIDSVRQWLRVAAEVEAPVSRIFGGHIDDRSNAAQLATGFDRILHGLGEVVREAERLGVVLALENHGGLPCTGEEQVDVIRKIGSKHLQATIDVGNYMQGRQEAHDGTAAAASCAAYIHFKDFHRTNDRDAPAWDIVPCIVGRGDIDHAKCLDVLRQSGYDGFVALEYEGPEDERIGVAESVAFMNRVMEGMSG